MENVQSITKPVENDYIFIKSCKKAVLENVHSRTKPVQNDYIFARSSEKLS